MKTVIGWLASLLVFGCDAKETISVGERAPTTQSDNQLTKQLDEVENIAQIIRQELGGHVVSCDRLDADASVYVDFGKDKITDDMLARLGSLSRIGWLVLEKKGITDAGLERIRGLTQLQTLDLDGNAEITDAGLKHFAGMVRMRHLRIFNSKVTDAGLSHLKRMSKLETLDLGQTKVTDAGLEQLVGLLRLDELHVDGTKVTPEGLKKFERAQQASIVRELGRATINQDDPRKPVAALDLSDTLLNDVGLEHVKGMKDLQILDLSNTYVTDAGLQHLNGLNSLKSLDLRETRVSDEGVKRLRRALPKCKIVESSAETR